MNGERTIPASREAVWVALNEPAILRRCLPGCESFERVSDVEFTVLATVKVGPVAAPYRGTIRLSDVDPPSGCRLEGEMRSESAGSITGSGRLELAAEGQATALRYTLEASFGGRLAQLGARLIDTTARGVAEEFFVRFEAAVGEPSAKATTPAPGLYGPAEARPAAHRPGLRPVIWVPALMLVVALILFMAA